MHERCMRVQMTAQGLAGQLACLPWGQCRAAQSVLCPLLLSRCPALESRLRQVASASARPRAQQLLAVRLAVRLQVPLPVLLPPLGMSRRGPRLAPHLYKVRRWPSWDRSHTTLKLQAGSGIVLCVCCVLAAVHLTRPDEASRTARALQSRHLAS